MAFYIAIEGNIGSGKTTLSRHIAEKYKFQLVLEPYKQSPYLKPFYSNMRDNAFMLELDLLMERHKKLFSAFSNERNGYRNVVSDFLLEKTLLFGNITLSSEQLKSIELIYSHIEPYIRKPDLIIYLRPPLEVLIANIKKRNRKYERDIQPVYLESIQNQYDNFLKNKSIIEVNQINEIEKVYLAINRYIRDTNT